MHEEWRPVVGYEGLYEVSSEERVRSLDRLVKSRWGNYRKVTGRYLKTHLDVDGYPIVTLSRDGANKKRKLSRVVAEAFIENPDGLPSVLHRDDIKTNNKLSNLYWGTAIQNAQDALRNGSNFRSSRTHCNRGHEFTPENTRYRNNRPNSRICITCERDLDSKRAQTRRDSEPPNHGTISSYVNHKCRCEVCKTAYSVYQKSRRSNG